MENIDSFDTKLAVSLLLLSIAKADDKIDKEEFAITIDILKDFFEMDAIETKNLINKALIELKKSTGIFKYAQHLNEIFNKTDKLDLINCIFEVAYADGNLHYLEHHKIKIIADILNLNRQDIINSKAQIERFLD